MTEDQAKTKWCHRTLADGPPYCVASACMAWRWREDRRTEAFQAALVERMKATGETLNKAQQELLKRRDEFAYTEGFCGLAGAPP